MILRGILDRALGGRVVFRGFAELGELARVSKADDSFQRDLLKDHKKEIQKFLRSSNQYFFFLKLF